MKRFPSDFEKIESGLKSYVESSTIKTRDLAILISSILRAFGDILTKTYEQADETTQQLINRSYFETFDWLNEFAFCR